MERGLLMKEYKKDGTQILMFLKGKVTTVRKKIQVWAVWDDEDEKDGWEKILPSKWKK